MITSTAADAHSLCFCVFGQSFATTCNRFESEIITKFIVFQQNISFSVTPHTPLSHASTVDTRKRHHYDRHMMYITTAATASATACCAPPSGLWSVRTPAVGSGKLGH